MKKFKKGDNLIENFYQHRSLFVDYPVDAEENIQWKKYSNTQICPSRNKHGYKLQKVR